MNATTSREVIDYGRCYEVAKAMTREFEMPVYVRADLQAAIASYLYCETDAEVSRSLYEQAKAGV